MTWRCACRRAWPRKAASRIGGCAGGADPSSAVYVKNKRKACRKVGIEAFDFDLPADTSEAEAGWLIDRSMPSEHPGILVQCHSPGNRMPAT